MSTLLEKALLTAFGIFILITFISLIYPLWNHLINFNGILGKDDNIYSNIINEIDESILFVINNPNECSEKFIEYPEGLNIFINDSYVKYQYNLANTSYYKFYQYNAQFLALDYVDIDSEIYRLKVYYKYNLIEIRMCFL